MFRKLNKTITPRPLFMTLFPVFELFFSTRLQVLSAYILICSSFIHSPFRASDESEITRVTPHTDVTDSDQS